MSSQENSSYEIGKAYAHKYENGADGNKVDKEVHDQLLQDFHKSMHSQVNMDQIKKGLVDESKHIPGLHLVDDNGLQIKRQYEPVPGVPVKLDAGKLFDISEAMANHNKLDTQEAAAKDKKDSGDSFKLGQIELPNPWAGLKYMSGEKH